MRKPGTWPALEQSYENPPFQVRHNHEGITRDFLTDSVSDITTLELEHATHYYVIASDNSGVFTDVSLRMKLPTIHDTTPRPASVMNEDWSRDVIFDEETGEWVITTHTMCFGDINIWMIPKFCLQGASVNQEPERWASPRELRNKKVIGAGTFSTLNLADANAPTPQFLAEHSDYAANHPFDGAAIPVRLDPPWCSRQGLMDPTYELHSLVMTKLPIPYEVLQVDVQNLNRVQWAHLTDNFLWYSVRDVSRAGDNDVRYSMDPNRTEDWAVVAQNAATYAKVCREAGLKGFMMDTKMYTNYETGELYPFGRGTPSGRLKC
jgi:hypothetical protein